MCNAGRLVSIQLRGMLGIGRFMHTRDKGQRVRIALVGLGVLLCAGVIAISLYALCEAALPVLRLAGLMDVLPALLFATSSIVCLTTSFFTGAGAVFDTRDVQILLPMPILTRVIVSARLLGLYVIDLLAELVIFVPVMLQYGRFASPAVGAYIFACVLGAFSLPVLPLLVGTALGAALQAISARSRHRNVVSIVLLCAFTLGAMVFSFYLSFGSASLDVGMLLRLSQVLTDHIVRLYPPTRLFVDAVHGAWGQAVLLAGLSWALFIAAVCALGRFYMLAHALISASPTARRGVPAREWRVRAPFTALVVREARHMIASPVYAVNTSFGLLLMVVLAGVFCVFGERILSFLEIGELAGVDVRGYAANGAAFVLFLLTTMAPTTCVSISLEGPAFTNLRALPIHARMILAAKAAYNMLLMIPAVLLSAVLTVMAFKLNGMRAISCFLLPLSGTILAPAWGLIANLLFPRFDWKSETEVVKQSLAAGVGVLGSILLCIVPFVVLIRIQIDLSAAAMALSIVYTALGVMCWGILLTWGVRRIRKI